MIIACSANTVKRIREARFRRAAKADGRPLVVDGKRELAALRAQMAARADACALVWNLDVVEASITNGDSTVGTVTTGYLYQHEAQFTVVLNSLDDADLCRIGQVAHNAVRAAFADAHICPDVTEAYLARADEFGAEVVDAAGLRFEWVPFEYGPADDTAIVSNADRSAAAGLTRARNYHEVVMRGGGGAYVSFEPIDRYACYRLNERRTEYKGADGRKRRAHPFVEMRKVASRFVCTGPVPAVELRLTLVEDGYQLRNCEAYWESDVPECWRTVTVPLGAPLSFLHGVVQKAFNWYDYHLHRFTFGDFGARELFDLLFEVEFEIDRWDGVSTEERRAQLQALGGLSRFKQLTGLDEKWYYHDFLAYAEFELLQDDFPMAQLPESMPVGLAMLGSDRYRDAARCQTPGCDLDVSDANALYYNYDFGDDWDLAIEVVRVLETPPADMPCVTGGAGHTPPEDCGGIGGFKDVIAAYELVNGQPDGDDDPGCAFDPDAADAEAWAREEALDEARDLLDWAHGAVGWRPFEGTASLAGTFDRPGNM